MPIYEAKYSDYDHLAGDSKSGQLSLSAWMQGIVNVVRYTQGAGAAAWSLQQLRTGTGRVPFQTVPSAKYSRLQGISGRPTPQDLTDLGAG